MLNNSKQSRMAIPILRELYHPQIKSQASTSVEWISDQSEWKAYIRGWVWKHEPANTVPALLELTVAACRAQTIKFRAGHGELSGLAWSLER